ncbi:MAG TPA: PhzF family phenazine biosynthesis protein [Chitinophagaceae bacterium]|nr:PhzF family phenazine biosynthesis protein [Chitinophagaceae bacterium]
MNIYQIDAFASKAFSGNPAAVIPLEQWPADQLMQQIAMENNLSETAFFVKTTEGYHIRWFTPTYEIDLCGHATLASAFVIKNYVDPAIEVINFSTQQVGPLTAICKDGKYMLDFPARMPVACERPAGLFESLGISDAVAVMRSRDYFIVLPDEDAVRNVQPDYLRMEKLDTIGVIVTARGNSADVVSRCFYPGLGIPEDPVTGSAHCNIVPYWCAQLSKNELFAKQLSARGGELWCELKGERVLMTGECVAFLKGELFV